MSKADEKRLQAIADLIQEAELLCETLEAHQSKEATIEVLAHLSATLSDAKELVVFEVRRLCDGG